MPRGSKKALGQIVPGLWIGRMAAVREIFHMQDDDSRQEEWSVVSMISSESMIRQISESLQDEQKQFKRKHNGRKLVQHHEVWDLPDKSDAPFVSSRLAEVLTIISNSIDDDNTTAADANNQQNRRPKRNCLVHCARGVSRSAAVCAAWLISAKGYSLPDSMDLLQAVRDVNPNLGFLAGLRAIAKCHGDVLQAERRLSRKSKKLIEGTTDTTSLDNNNNDEAAATPKQQKSEELKVGTVNSNSNSKSNNNNNNNKENNHDKQNSSNVGAVLPPPVKNDNKKEDNNSSKEEKAIEVAVGNETNLSNLLEESSSKQQEKKKVQQYSDEVSC